MIDIFAQLILKSNELLFNNLGLTIIVIGVLSRAIFYPFFASSIRYSKVMRELKPKLDGLKKKHGKDMKKMAAEQSRLFREAGVSPAAGALGCVSIVIQLGIFILLFQALRQVIASGVATDFLIWDLGVPDTYQISGLPLPIPGVLLILTAFFAFIQSKMTLPTGQPAGKNSKKTSKKAGKPDFSEALSSSLGRTAYIFPLIILVSGAQFSSGLALYWFVSTIFGIGQQYRIAGLGGLEPWLAKLRRA